METTWFLMWWLEMRPWSISTTLIQSTRACLEASCGPKMYTIIWSVGKADYRFFGLFRQSDDRWLGNTDNLQCWKILIITLKLRTVIKRKRCGMLSKIFFFMQNNAFLILYVRHMNVWKKLNGRFFNIHRIFRTLCLVTSSFTHNLKFIWEESHS